MFKQVWYNIIKNMFKQVNASGGIKVWENMGKTRNSCYAW